VYSLHCYDSLSFVSSVQDTLSHELADPAFREALGDIDEKRPLSVLVGGDAFRATASDNITIFGHRFWRPRGAPDFLPFPFRRFKIASRPCLTFHFETELNQSSRAVTIDAAWQGKDDLENFLLHGKTLAEIWFDLDSGVTKLPDPLNPEHNLPLEVLYVEDGACRRAFTNQGSATSRFNSSWNDMQKALLGVLRWFGPISKTARELKRRQPSADIAENPAKAAKWARSEEGGGSHGPNPTLFGLDRHCYELLHGVIRNVSTLVLNCVHALNQNEGLLAMHCVFHRLRFSRR